jgi:hypothetical protein
MSAAQAACSVGCRGRILCSTMAYRLSLPITCCALLATALVSCESDDDATRFAEFTEPLLEKYTPMQICMKTCEHCAEVHSCSKFCNESLSDATPACEDELALFLLAVQGDVFVTGQCRSAPVTYEFAMKLAAERIACIDVYGCLNLDVDRSQPCEPVHDGGSTACGCSKECKAGTVYRTDCPATSSTTIDCNCFVEDVLVGTCQQSFLDRCDQWNGCCHQYFPLLPE